MVHRWFYGVALLKLVYRRRNQSRTSQSNVELKTMVSSSDSCPLLESKKHSRNGISIAFELAKKMINWDWAKMEFQARSWGCHQQQVGMIKPPFFFGSTTVGFFRFFRFRPRSFMSVIWSCEMMLPMIQTWYPLVNVYIAIENHHL